MNSKKQQLCIVIALFLLAALWYFFPVGEEKSYTLLFRMRLALPAFILMLGGIGLAARLITMGLAFCTLGDAMGVLGSFEGQMGGFAVAQICFISQFVKEIRLSSHKKIRPAVMAFASLLCLPPLIIAMLNVIPAVPIMPIRIGCIIYALLLLSSVWTSTVRAFTVKEFIAMAGAIIFLTSDSILGWNKFVEHIPHAGTWILSTYYAALLLIFLGTLRTHGTVR